MKTLQCIQVLGARLFYRTLVSIPASSLSTTLPEIREMPEAGDPFAVPLFQHLLGGLVDGFRSFWVRMGELETVFLSDLLAHVRVQMPIYVCGLARSGSTLLHEFVSSHPAVATYRMKDYPFVFTPYWWRQATRGIKSKDPRERPHGDGMMVTLESPDAIEEMLWMSFFPQSHNPSRPHVLGSDVAHHRFEAFYDATLRKLLLVEGATRFAAKNNYHVGRLHYLLRLYPDAKFLIPIRSPAGHVASLLRQQRTFSQGHRLHPRSLSFMRRSGHFEFGRLRRPINLGDSDRVRRIQSLWASGEEVRGVAVFWDMVYGWLARVLSTNEQLRAAALVVRHETICESPEDTLRLVLRHCRLPGDEEFITRWVRQILKPTPPGKALTESDLNVVELETRETARIWGYDRT